MVGSTPPSRCVPPKFPGKKINFRSPRRDDRLLAVSRGINGSIQAFPRANRAELVLPGRHTVYDSGRESGDFPGGAVAETLHLQCGGLGSVPGQGTRAHMPQLRVHMLQLKISHATQ